jgi:N-acetylmuramoyl-L-alanine amidase
LQYGVPGVKGEGLRLRWGRLASLGVIGVGASLGLAIAAHGAVKGGVLKVRLGGDQKETRVVIELDRATRGELISDGGRQDPLVLDLKGVAAVDDQSGQGLGLVKAWSVQNAAGQARLTLAVNGPVTIKRRFLLAPSEGWPMYRYVVDVAATGPGRRAPTDPMRAQKVADKILAHSRRTIVIDAGHGGKDPGASGGKAREKDLTLAAAKALKKRLEHDGRYRVVLTRSTDDFVPLGARVQIARRANADLFISLHADAGLDPETRGATVYTLSDQGSDRAARKLISNDWFMNVSLPGRDKAVNRILLDLTQRATKNQSTAFAETLIDNIGADTLLLRRSHRDAGFVVLLAPDVPAVLLEMGFITNPDDERTLADSGKRARLMGAVAESIDTYFAGQSRLASR